MNFDDHASLQEACQLKFNDERIAPKREWCPSKFVSENFLCGDDYCYDNPATFFLFYLHALSASALGGLSGVGRPLGPYGPWGRGGVLAVS